MSSCWHFYRFDYARYLEIRPALRSATLASSFAALADGPETEAVAEAVEEGEIGLLEARQAFVQAACCLGEPLAFDKGLPRFVAALSHRPGAEDAAELLGELLAGGKNIEPWLCPPVGLTGFLTPEETATAFHSYTSPPRRRRKSGRNTPRRRRPRRGGLLGVCVGFLRRLFDWEPQAGDLMTPLGEFLAEAAQNAEGIAVVAV